MMAKTLKVKAESLELKLLARMWLVVNRAGEW